MAAIERNNQVSVRLSDRESAALDAMCKHYIRNRSDMLRAIIDDAAKKMRVEIIREIGTASIKG